MNKGGLGAAARRQAKRRREFDRLFRAQSATISRVACMRLLWLRLQFQFVALLTQQPTKLVGHTRTRKLRRVYRQKRHVHRTIDAVQVAFRRDAQGKLPKSKLAIKVRKQVRERARAQRITDAQFGRWLKRAYASTLPMVEGRVLETWITENSALLITLGIKVPSRKLPRGVPGSDPRLRFATPFLRGGSSKREWKIDKRAKVLDELADPVLVEVVTYQDAEPAPREDDESLAWLAEHPSWHQPDSRRENYHEYILIKRRRAKKLMRRPAKPMQLVAAEVTHLTRNAAGDLVISERIKPDILAEQTHWVLSPEQRADDDLMRAQAREAAKAQDKRIDQAMAHVSSITPLSAQQSYPVANAQHCMHGVAWELDCGECDKLL